MKQGLMIGVAVLAMAAAAPAVAQDAGTAGTAAGQNAPPASDGNAASLPDSSASTAADTPGDIVVTAQKRSERLQAVPVAVSVLSGDAIAAKGGTNLESAQYLVPTLNFRKSGTAINQSLFLRGVGTSTFSIAGEPSISTIVDGVVYSRAGEAFSDLIDIDRIEVLRGPQGTLFGKNASAGVINIVTKRPGSDFGGFVEGGYFTNGDEYRVRGAIDVPVADWIKTRITGFYGHYNGNIRNLAQGGARENGYEHYGVRGVAVVTPSPDITFTLIGDYRRAKDNCCAEVIGTAAAASASGNPNLALPAERGDRTRLDNENLITATREKSYGVSGQLDWTLGTQTITYIGSYRIYDNEEIRDGDFLPQAYVGYNQLHDDGPQVSNTLTQELRLTSPAHQLFSYVVGAFFSRAYTARVFNRTDIVCTGGAVSATTLTPCGSAGTVTTVPSGTADFGSVFKNLALFGQGTLNLTGRLRLIGGVRYTTDQLDVFHRRATSLAGPGINGNFDQGVFAGTGSNGVPFTAKTTNTNWSGKGGVQFDLLSKSTVYATYSRGYKGPAFNIFYNLTATGTNVIQPETADSWEAGIKNTLLGGKLVVNIAGYYAKYHNFQANNPDVGAGVLVTRFTNAGEISTRGVELDALFRPVRDLSFNGGFAYTDAHIDQFKVPTNGSNTGIVPSGTQLPYAPRYKGSLSRDYRIRTGGRIDFTVGSQASVQSSQISQLDASQAIRDATTIHPYALVDLSAGLVEASDRFRVTFQVKNVFDEHFAAAITSGGPGGAYRYIIPREADRYYGVTARVGF